MIANLGKRYQSTILCYRCLKEGYIYSCVTSGRIWHVFFFFLEREFGEGEVVHVRCWSMLVIGSLGAMWIYACHWYTPTPAPVRITVDDDSCYLLNFVKSDLQVSACLQYLQLQIGHPLKYWTVSSLLNFVLLAGTGPFRIVDIINFETQNKDASLRNVSVCLRACVWTCHR